MALIAGTRLGPYEILAPIGKGGMGEVYKATDTRLDRAVAVKLSIQLTVNGGESATTEGQCRSDGVIGVSRLASAIEHRRYGIVVRIISEADVWSRVFLVGVAHSLDVVVVEVIVRLNLALWIPNGTKAAFPSLVRVTPLVRRVRPSLFLNAPLDVALPARLVAARVDDGIQVATTAPLSRYRSVERICRARKTS